MTDKEMKTADSIEEEQKKPRIWGGFIIDIFKILLEFNQMPWGIKKKF